MCGVPIDAADDYLARLIAPGPSRRSLRADRGPGRGPKRGAKALVRRAVRPSRDAGTITEERLLEPGRANNYCWRRARPAGEGRIVRPRRARHLDRRLRLGETGEPALGPGDRAHRAERDRRAAGAVRRSGLRPAVGRDGRRGDAAARERSTPLRPRGWSRTSTASPPRRVRLFRPRRDRRRGAGARLPRAPRSMPCRGSSARRAARAAPGSRSTPRRAQSRIVANLVGERAGSVIATIDLTMTPAGARLLAERLAIRSPRRPRSTNGSTRSNTSSRRRRCATPCARRSPRRRISCAR